MHHLEEYLKEGLLSLIDFDKAFVFYHNVLKRFYFVLSICRSIEVSYKHAKSCDTINEQNTFGKLI